MMRPTQAIKQAATIAELRANAEELAALARPQPLLVLTSGTQVQRRLLLLLARERRRSAALLAELVK